MDPAKDFQCTYPIGSTVQVRQPDVPSDDPGPVTYGRVLGVYFTIDIDPHYSVLLSDGKTLWLPESALDSPST